MSDTIDDLLLTVATMIKRVAELQAELEAEVAALCGRPEALDPYLPGGWRWEASCDEWHGPNGLFVQFAEPLVAYRAGHDCEGTPDCDHVVEGASPLGTMRAATGGER